ncbi:AAA family ATPase [bacterium]|nr:AAA family ATPase [bacterium]
MEDKHFMSRLEIKNFKSVKKVEFPTKRVNVFIGEPNSGKSNILESLYFLSINAPEYLSEIVRGKDIGNLAFDSNFNEPISVMNDVLSFKIQRKPNSMTSFEIQYFRGSDELSTAYFNSNITIGEASHLFDTNFKFYQYKNLNGFNNDHRPFLSPPFGQNLPTLLLGNTKFKKIVADIYNAKGLRLVLKPVTQEIEIVKDFNDELLSYPYHTTSETLRRYAFMLLAIESNENSILIFDEPEANTFPFYTKMVAEMIGMDNRNQYFISTHNPYLLMSLIEKTKKDDLNIIKTEMIDFETKTTVLNSDTYGDLLEMGSDIFYEFEKLG